MVVGVVVQYGDEAILHWQFDLYTVPYEIPVSTYS